MPMFCNTTPVTKIIDIVHIYSKIYRLYGVTVWVIKTLLLISAHVNLKSYLKKYCYFKTHGIIGTYFIVAVVVGANLLLGYHAGHLWPFIQDKGPIPQYCS